MARAGAVIDLDAHVRALVREELAAALANRDAATGPVLVTMDAYARARSISLSTVRAAIRDGRLEAHRIGRAVRVRSTDEIAQPVRAKVNRTSAAARRLGLQVVR